MPGTRSPAVPMSHMSTSATPWNLAHSHDVPALRPRFWRGRQRIGDCIVAGQHPTAITYPRPRRYLESEVIAGCATGHATALKSDQLHTA